MTSSKSIQVFVHLAMNKDVRQWREAFAAGTLVGINDETPYGYGRAEAMGCAITFSRRHGHGPFGQALRLALRLLFGFDFLHAWHQRHDMARADIIWTHTESQFLGAAAVLLLTRANTLLLGQVVWLIDQWPRLGWWRRWFYRRLIDRVDVMTFHSRLNHARAGDLFPGKDLRIVPFGIPAEATSEPRLFGGGPIHVLAVGNDRHRDWNTLVEAVGGEPGLDLTILSGAAPARLARSFGNVSIHAVKNQTGLIDAMHRADVVCIPLKPNLHASGATALQEGVLSGIPVIASDVGGLDLYFARDEVTYIPPGDAASLRQAIHAIARDPHAAQERARAAQRRMGDRATHGVQAYIARHVDISRELLARSAQALARDARGPLAQPAAAGQGVATAHITSPSILR